jgi:L-amino acid N-acyltransferase YncA
VSCSVRDSVDADVDGAARIYAHWVEHGLASFELVPPPPDAMAQRRAAILADGFPYLVAADPAGELLGFACASWYRTRPAYRFTCEDSVYVLPSATGRGVGRALLEELLRRCTAMELRLMVAVIGDSGNAASIALHRRAGFEMAGVLRSIGWKHGRWVDSVLMARPLGGGDRTPPVEATTAGARARDTPRSASR